MNIFGTDGVRSKVGTKLFTLDNLPTLGRAIAQWAQQKYGPSPKIVLAHDTRISCGFVKSACKSGLLLSPVTLADLGVLPTPALAQLLNIYQDFNLGIIISASHNPYYDNGIKLIDKVTGKLSEQDELIISELFSTMPVTIDYTQCGTELFLSDASDIYVETICSFFPANLLAHKKIVLDTAHGATFLVAPRIFKKLGATIIALNNNPTGSNINEKCGATDLTSLQKAVQGNKADIGFAFDGDGDRVMAVTATGEVKNGDDILALLSQHVRYNKASAIVGTVMSNQGLEDFLCQKEKRLLRTAVGDKYVAEALQENNLLLGGEQSGHIIVKDLGTTGDGIVAALRMCEVFQATDNWNFKTFEKYPQVLISSAVTYKADLSQGPAFDVIKKAEQQLLSGRILVRYSGTENLLRVMVEEKDLSRAQKIARDLTEQLTHIRR